jgi:single-strand DNA-binding protein
MKKMNVSILVGRLTKNPELKATPNGKEFSQFTIAVNRAYTSKDGEKQTDFISCVCWGQTASNLCKYQSKGSLIGVIGQIQTRQYEDKNGVNHYITEVFCESIEFLSSKSESNNNTQNYNERPSQGQYQPKTSDISPSSFEREEKQQVKYNDDVGF